ncbi:PDZ domain-containing protein [Nostocoides sp. F2B08]|uniref:S1C family serine protease n=1 Tax=Nostocoides sp. F2B08 TaxID=2653936 RepID=UPI001262E05E|nr:trypsin-like peptidase domain-containing protein [Tetrasphaera sp. F2B08]KAB7741369.1 PDZ domain-containing protein [Tetrasphaera sp. F2B08]
MTITTHLDRPLTDPPAPVTAPPQPAPPAEPATGGGGRPGVGRLGLTALLAAVLASGATLAVDRSLVDTSTSNGAGSVPVSAVDGATSWTSVASAVTPSVVSIAVEGAGGLSEGSGVVWDSEGRIVTNDHVVAGAAAGGAVRATLADGRTFAATVTGTDPTTDLAVITLTDPPPGLVPLSRGDSTTLQVGDPVMAVGNPLGLSGTVTTGIVSALNRPVAASGPSQGQGGLAQVTNAIQTSAPINPGNSGGALVDAHGRLIGINSSIATLGASSGGAPSGNIGIGFAIPIAEADTIVAQLISAGSAQHAYLGISTRDTALQDGTSSVPGALVAGIVPGGPAEVAGLQDGDVITEINGEAVSSSQSLIGTVRALAVDQRVSLTIIRDGTPTTVEVTLAAAHPSR